VDRDFFLFGAKPKPDFCWAWECPLDAMEFDNFLNTLVTVSLDERFKRIITNETNYTSSRQADLFSEFKIFY